VKVTSRQDDKKSLAPNVAWPSRAQDEHPGARRSTSRTARPGPRRGQEISREPEIRPLAARLAYQGAVTGAALLPALLCKPVAGVDFTSGHQLQADHEQIRHHDASDDEHAAAGSEHPHRMANRGWIAKPTCRQDSKCLRGVPLKKEVPLGSGPYRGDHE
jgi:hypothetical protein